MFPTFFSFLGGPCAVDEDVQLPYPLVLPNQRTGISRASLLSFPLPSDPVGQGLYQEDPVAC